jgi:drug/metabolite transporter (DMT)-like permease
MLSPKGDADMRELLDFLLTPVRRTPWRAATVFGAFLGLILVVGDVIPVLQPLGTALGVATCLAAGVGGASRGREFDQGIATVFAAIVIALISFVVVMSSPAASAEPLDLPAGGMLLLGVPVGAVGAGIATWLNHRASAAT